MTHEEALEKAAQALVSSVKGRLHGIEHVVVTDPEREVAREVVAAYLGALCSGSASQVDQLEKALHAAFAALTDRSLNDGMARARAGVILQEALGDKGDV